MTRLTVLIDPGHGGTADRRLSTAYGSPVGRRPGGRELEKDINLDVARRVCDQLGSAAVLSRSGDYNLSLRERIERARAARAAAFVSIHSNTGRTDHDRPEVWVFGDSTRAAGRASVRLAERIRSELSAVERIPVTLRKGNLALLRPELHGDGVAACLVETGSLRHRSGKARMSDRRTLNQISDAVARGVSRYLESDLSQRRSSGSQ